ncbi:hypothetical protein [Nocardia sp. NPDC050175]|uniref:phthiocerol/phthiodiolone dimycocerosyl transferase family protein n=1 Tax=Nocardia sp. NPDC050175 TaxID=3364317 RepID=UPI00378D86BB
MVETAVRLLAPSEELWARLGTVVGCSVRVRGPLDLAALADAFEGVRRRYPVLVTHLAVADGGHLVVGPSAPLPSLTVCEGDIDDPLCDLDPGRVLSGLHVVRDGDRATVTLLTHHSIADGQYVLAVLDDLWSLYTDMAQGNTVVTASRGYPESLETLFADRGIAKRGFDDAEPSTPVAIDPGPEQSSDTGQQPVSNPPVRCRLDAAATTALVEFGRRHQVTVNGLVTAAILRTEADVKNVPLAEIPYCYVVDLRTRMTPAVARLEVTNALGYATFTASSDATGLADLARAVNEELRYGLAEGAVHRSALQFPESFLQYRMPDTIPDTNWGRIPSLRSPVGVELEDFRGIIRHHPQADLAAAMGKMPYTPAYIITTFRGRLSIEHVGIEPGYRDWARGRIVVLESYLRSVA